MALGTTSNGNFLSLTAPATNTQIITVICWVRFSSLPGSGGFQCIWSIDDNANFVQLFLQNSAGVTMDFTVTGITNMTLLNPPVVNQWYRVAIVHTPGAANCVAWVNKPGQAPSKTTSGSTGQNLPSATCFVYNESGNDFSIGGELCGFQFYDRQLSEQEIRAGAQQLEPINTNKLRYYLPLTANGAPEISRGGFGPKPTLTGSLSWTAQTPVRPRLNRSYNNKRIINTAPNISAPNIDSLFFGAGTTS